MELFTSPSQEENGLSFFGARHAKREKKKIQQGNEWHYLLLFSYFTKFLSCRMRKVGLKESDCTCTAQICNYIYRIQNSYISYILYTPIRGIIHGDLVSNNRFAISSMQLQRMDISLYPSFLTSWPPATRRPHEPLYRVSLGRQQQIINNKYGVEII